ncbi:hypothetical protein ACROYT_G031274 [Oculina patagonica]
MAFSKDKDWKKYGISAAAKVRHASDGSSFDIYSDSEPSFTVTTIHISCQSDTYRNLEPRVTPGSAIRQRLVSETDSGLEIDTYRGSGPKYGQPWYGGIIIYARNGQTDWRTANGTHCKSGYLVIMRTDTSEFEELRKKWNEPGIVHGTIYRKAFGESCNDVTVVGEGFGIMDGKFTIQSGAFNPAHGDNYHDSSSLMHEDSARYVEKLVDIWKLAGPSFPERQNYSVKEL